jgi:hypothetical protein
VQTIDFSPERIALRGITRGVPADFELSIAGNHTASTFSAVWVGSDDVIHTATVGPLSYASGRTTVPFTFDSAATLNLDSSYQWEAEMNDVPIAEGPVRASRDDLGG